MKQNNFNKFCKELIKWAEQKRYYADITKEGEDIDNIYICNLGNNRNVMLFSWQYSLGSSDGNSEWCPLPDKYEQEVKAEIIAHLN